MESLVTNGTRPIKHAILGCFMTESELAVVKESDSVSFQLEVGILMIAIGGALLYVACTSRGTKPFAQAFGLSLLAYLVAIIGCIIAAHAISEVTQLGNTSSPPPPMILY